MDARAILNAIGTLIDRMPGSDERERLLAYSAIRVLCLDLEDLNKLCQYSTGHTAGAVSEFLRHCRRCAGLEGDGRGVEEHTARARQALADLSSDACFRE